MLNNKLIAIKIARYQVVSLTVADLNMLGIKYSPEVYSQIRALYESMASRMADRFLSASI